MFGAFLIGLLAVAVAGATGVMAESGKFASGTLAVMGGFSAGIMIVALIFANEAGRRSN